MNLRQLNKPPTTRTFTRTLCPGKVRKENMKLLTILVTLLTVTLTSCTTPSQRPLCRHIVLSQYAAFKDAGYPTRIVHLKNTSTLNTPKFKYHAAVQIQSPTAPNEWLYVEQPPITFTTTTTPPPNTQFIKILNPKTVLQWTERVKLK